MRSYQFDDFDDLDKVMQEESMRVPSNAITTEGPVWYSDQSIYDEKNDSDQYDLKSTKAVKGYNHKNLVSIIAKSLKKFREENEGWFPENIKNLKLIGLRRDLWKDKGGNIKPYQYWLSIGSYEDPRYRFDFSSDHDLTVYADDPEKIRIEG